MLLLHAHCIWGDESCWTCGVSAFIGDRDTFTGNSSHLRAAVTQWSCEWRKGEGLLAPERKLKQWKAATGTVSSLLLTGRVSVWQKILVAPSGFSLQTLVSPDHHQIIYCLNIHHWSSGGDQRWSTRWPRWDHLEYSITLVLVVEQNCADPQIHWMILTLTSLTAHILLTSPAAEERTGLIFVLFSQILPVSLTVAEEKCEQSRKNEGEPVLGLLRGSLIDWFSLKQSRWGLQFIMVVWVIWRSGISMSAGVSLESIMFISTGYSWSLS